MNDELLEWLRANATRVEIIKPTRTEEYWVSCGNRLAGRGLCPSCRTDYDPWHYINNISCAGHIRLEFRARQDSVTTSVDSSQRKIVYFFNGEALEEVRLRVILELRNYGW